MVAIQQKTSSTAHQATGDLTVNGGRSASDETKCLNGLEMLGENAGSRDWFERLKEVVMNSWWRRCGNGPQVQLYMEMLQRCDTRTTSKTRNHPVRTCFAQSLPLVFSPEGRLTPDASSFSSPQLINLTKPVSFVSVPLPCDSRMALLSSLATLTR